MLKASRFFLFFLSFTIPFSPLAHDNSEQQLASDTANIVNLVVPGGSDSKTVRNPFVAELLMLIFEKNQKTVSIEYVQQRLLQGRALKELADNNLINLTWSATTREREQQLAAIKIPIYQGLIGWRVLMIHPDSQIKFAQDSSLHALKSLLGVQQFDWPDYKVLTSNGFTVEGNIDFLTMSKTLQDKLIDYFPRSVLEIGRELDLPRNEGLIAEKHLLFKYPSAYYFFVNKNDKKLHQLIEQGFKLAIADGSYQRLFGRYFNKQLRQLALSQRRVVELTNPTVDRNSFATNPNYWYKP